jgi:hypothetical protein
MQNLRVSYFHQKLVPISEMYTICIVSLRSFKVCEPILVPLQFLMQTSSVTASSHQPNITDFLELVRVSKINDL